VEKNVLIFGILAYFCIFPLLPKLKLYFKNVSVHVILVLNTTFVLNMTFLGLLSPEILFGEKTVTHTDTQLISPSVNLGVNKNF